MNCLRTALTSANALNELGVKVTYSVEYGGLASTTSFKPSKSYRIRPFRHPAPVGVLMVLVFGQPVGDANHRIQLCGVNLNLALYRVFLYFPSWRK